MQLSAPGDPIQFLPFDLVHLLVWNRYLNKFVALAGLVAFASSLSYFVIKLAY